MPLNHTSSYRIVYFMSLDRTSFYRIIYLMSLDRTSFYWIGRHSIGLYTSYHWIGRHFIVSYLILSDYISCHWIRNAIQSDQRLFEKSLFPRVLLYIRFSKKGFSVTQGRSQDLSKGGSHWVIQRVLTRLSPEYCGLSAYKKAYKGGGHGHPRTPPPWLRPCRDVQGKHRKTQEQLRASNIKTVLLDVMNELASNADVDCGLYKLEWLCSVVLSLTQSFSQHFTQCKNKVNLTASWKLIVS